MYVNAQTYNTWAGGECVFHGRFKATKMFHYLITNRLVDLTPLWQNFYTWTFLLQIQTTNTLSGLLHIKKRLMK